MFSRHFIPGKGEADSGEVGSAADAADDDIRVFIHHGKLLPALKADHRLVEADMVEHRS